MILDDKRDLDNMCNMSKGVAYYLPSGGEPNFFRCYEGLITFYSKMLTMMTSS